MLKGSHVVIQLIVQFTQLLTMVKNTQKLPNFRNMTMIIVKPSVFLKCKSCDKIPKQQAN